MERQLRNDEKYCFPTDAEDVCAVVAIPRVRRKAESKDRERNKKRKVAMEVEESEDEMKMSDDASNSASSSDKSYEDMTKPEKRRSRRLLVLRCCSYPISRPFP